MTTPDRFGQASNRLGQNDVTFAIVVLVVSVWFASPARAQTTATITGQLADSSRAVLPGVSLTLRQSETGMTRTMVSDTAGRFVFAGLPVGRYELRAELPAFRPLVRPDIVVTVNQTLALSLVMELGEVQQEVTVVGGAAPINVTTPELSYLVGEKSMETLPLNGRNYSDLALLQPGVLADPSRDGGSVVAHGLGMSVNGQHFRSNVYLLDGTLQNDFTNGPAGSAMGTTLGMDTIRQFRVESNAYGAEFGRNFGGQINVLTKSGTNSPRGSAYEFHRDDGLNAANYFDVNGKPAFTRNQFGGTLGGPLRRDRVFFFFGVERLQESLGRTISSFVPDDNARLGILPTGTVSINPLIQPYLDAIPRANGPVIGGGLATYTFPFDQQTNEGFVQGRLDYNAGTAHQFFARYTYDDGEQQLPTDYLPYPRSFLSRNQFFTGEYRNIWSDHTLQTFRFGFSRTNIGQNVAANHASPLPPFVPGRDLVGDIDIGGMQRFGPQISANLRLFQNVFSGQYDITQTRGRHLLKAGALAEHFVDHMINPTFSLGDYVFSDVRAFLQNQPLRFVGLTPQTAIDRTWPFTLLAGYGQDSVQVTPRLTLTGGLRYEFVTLPVDTGGHDLGLVHLSDPAATVGQLYQNPTGKNVSPRTGFAWDVFGTGTTSVRGGYGLYFNSLNQHTLIISASSPTIIVNPTFPSPSFAVGVGRPIRAVEWDLQNPRLHMWNTSVEQLLPGSIVATIGYAGSRGVHLLRSGDVNVPTPTLQPDGRLLFPPAGTPRPNPNFSAIELMRSNGDSWYKALIVEARRQWRNGFSVQSSYTWSRSEDTSQGGTFFSDATNGTSSAFPEFGTGYNKGPSDWDTPHNWVSNIIWEVPFAKGRHGWTGALLDGWQLTAISNMRSGQPLTAFVLNNRSRSLWSPAIAPGTGLDRPDLAPGRTPDSAVLGLPNEWFDPTAFRLQPAGMFGNSARNAFRGPNLRTVDVAGVKRVPLHGQARLEVRIEAFNVFNRANFGNPTLVAFTGAADNEQPLATFGRIRSTVTSARQLQLGVRMDF